MRILIKLFVNLFHNVYSYKSSRKLKAFADLLYTFWISNNIRKVGKNTLIRKGCYLVGGKYIELGDNIVIGRHGVVTCWDSFSGVKFTPQIIIGNNTAIGEYCHISSINSILIGNGVLMGRGVTITDNSHGALITDENNIPPSKREFYSKGGIIIEDNVWIGDKVSILAGVHISKGAVIAANAVVTKDVPENFVVGGVPAKVIKIIK